MRAQAGAEGIWKGGVVLGLCLSGSLNRAREVKAGISHPTPGVGHGLQWGSLQVASRVG